MKHGIAKAKAKPKPKRKTPALKFNQQECEDIGVCVGKLIRQHKHDEATTVFVDYGVKLYGTAKMRRLALAFVPLLIAQLQRLRATPTQIMKAAQP